MSIDRRRDHVALNREYDGDSSTLRAARSDVVSYLRAHKVAQDLQERAQLVVSELASNAIEAAPGVDYGVRASVVDDGSVVISVTSTTEQGGPPPREAWGPADARAPRGRGLMIVGELTDRVEIERSEIDTIVVTAHFGRPPQSINATR